MYNSLSTVISIQIKIFKTYYSYFEKKNSNDFE